MIRLNTKATIEDVLQAVKDDGAVTVVGFGTFTLREHGERIRRNPATQKEVTVPPGKSISFRPTRSLKKDLTA